MSYLSIGLLVAGSLALPQAASAQNNAAPAPSNSQQQAANPSGGWKRVGDASAQDQSNAPPYPTYSSNQAPQYDPNQGGDGNAPPPPPPPPQSGATTQQQPYAGQQPYNQPQPPYPPAQQQPMYAPPAPYGQNGYGQAGYGQGAYGQGNYNQVQQPSYPAPSPVPAQITIPAGTFITVRVNQRLSSDHNQPGDAFTATLVEPVVANGVVVAEPGQTLSGRVAVVEKHSMGHPARLGVQLTSLSLVDGQQVPVTTQLTARRGGTTPGGVEAGTVVATTGVGAAIGAAAGWGTGAAIGAGAGALAGLIGVVVTHNHASVIYPEQVLTFRIEAPVTISTQNGSYAFRYVQPGEYDRAPAPGPYAAGYSAAPAPPPYYYPYAYPYYYGYPYWGPGFSFYFGPRFYGYGRFYRR
jgi:hypothetical protein